MKNRGIYLFKISFSYFSIIVSQRFVKKNPTVDFFHIFYACLGIMKPILYIK